MDKAQTGTVKEPGNRTPRLKQTWVIAKKLLGKSNRQIAREEGKNPHTVGRILNDSDYLRPARISSFNATAHRECQASPRAQPDVQIPGTA